MNKINPIARLVFADNEPEYRDFDYTEVEGTEDLYFTEDQLCKILRISKHTLGRRLKNIDIPCKIAAYLKGEEVYLYNIQAFIYLLYTSTDRCTDLRNRIGDAVTDFLGSQLAADLPTGLLEEEDRVALVELVTGKEYYEFAWDKLLSGDISEANYLKGALRDSLMLRAETYMSHEQIMRARELTTTAWLMSRNIEGLSIRDALKKLGASYEKGEEEIEQSFEYQRLLYRAATAAINAREEKSKILDYSKIDSLPAYRLANYTYAKLPSTAPFPCATCGLEVLPGTYCHRTDWEHRCRPTQEYLDKKRAAKEEGTAT